MTEESTWDDMQTDLQLTQDELRRLWSELKRLRELVSEKQQLEDTNDDG